MSKFNVHVYTEVYATMRNIEANDAQHAARIADDRVDDLRYKVERGEVAWSEGPSLGFVVDPLLDNGEVDYEKSVQIEPDPDTLASRVDRAERGWAGHYICSERCMFRRNTLLSLMLKGEVARRIVVSTVGLQRTKPDVNGMVTAEEIGCGRYFETAAFEADAQDTRFHDADVNRRVAFDSPGSIGEVDADDQANDMHEAIVAEITAKLLDGTLPQTQPDQDHDA